MAKRKTHPDVEFQVSYEGAPTYDTFNTFDEAAVKAVVFASMVDKSYIDILVWSRKGARWLGGDDAVEQYDEDPEASVFERIEIEANVVGRIA